LSKIRKFHADRYIFNKLIRSPQIDGFHTAFFDFEQKLAIANGKHLLISDVDIQNFIDSQNKMGNTAYIYRTEINYKISWMRGSDDFKQNLIKNVNNDPHPQFIMDTLFSKICSNSNSEGMSKKKIIECISSIYLNVKYENSVESPAKKLDLRSHIENYCQILETENYISSTGKKKQKSYFASEKGYDYFKQHKNFPSKLIPKSLLICPLYKGEYSIVFIDDRSCTYTVNQVNKLSLERVCLLYANLIKFINVKRDEETLDKVRIIMNSIKSRWNAVGHINGKIFRWPTTLIIPSTGSSKFGDIDNKSGLLSHIGYHVGRTSSLTHMQRRRILDDVFLKSLSGYDFPNIATEWSEPNSSERLKKLAYTIASFVKNAKRRKLEKMDVAIEQWEWDLNYLYNKFYLGRFKFVWPV